MSNLHRSAGQLEPVQVLHGLLGVLGLVVDDESVALGPVRVRVLHQLDRLNPAKRLENSLKIKN